MARGWQGDPRDLALKHILRAIEALPAEQLARGTRAGAPHGASMLAALCSALVSARATDERVFAKLASVLLSVIEGGAALSVQTIAVYSNLRKAALLVQKYKITNTDADGFSLCVCADDGVAPFLRKVALLVQKYEY